MKHIVLTPEQVQIVLQAGEPVEVRDEKGRTVARLTPFDPADIEAIEQSRRSIAAGGPRVPSAQVQAHLRKLEEIRQREGMDEPKMLELLRRMRAGEERGGNRGTDSPTVSVGSAGQDPDGGA